MQVRWKHKCCGGNRSYNGLYSQLAMQCASATVVNSHSHFDCNMSWWVTLEENTNKWKNCPPILAWASHILLLICRGQNRIPDSWLFSSFALWTTMKTQRLVYILNSSKLLCVVSSAKRRCRAGNQHDIVLFYVRTAIFSNVKPMNHRNDSQKNFAHKHFKVRNHIVLLWT